jgi:hypothetical protein
VIFEYSQVDASGMRFFHKEVSCVMYLKLCVWGVCGSGLVLCDKVKWVSFHSGYDFGYLLKLLTCAPLPAEEGEFFKLLHTYFPAIFDVKNMMVSCDFVMGGLNRLAEDLSVSGV